MTTSEHAMLGRSRPTAKDQFESHTVEVIVCIVTLVLGILVLAGGVYPDFDPAPSLADLRPTMVGILTSIFIAGPTIWLKAIFTTYTYMDQEWLRVRIGSGLFTCGWTMYTAVCILSNPQAIFAWVDSIGLTILGYHYLSQVIRTESDMLEAKRYVDTKNTNTNK